MWNSKPPTCNICNKELSTCYRCRRCRGKWCLDCVGSTTYDCVGANHYFSENCCDDCVPEYGRIIDGNYYCPVCAPEDQVLEYNFKRAVYLFQEKIINKYRRCQSLHPDYLNDPTNWERYTKEPKKMEEEWEKEMINS